MKKKAKNNVYTHEDETEWIKEQQHGIKPYLGLCL